MDSEIIEAAIDFCRHYRGIRALEYEAFERLREAIERKTNASRRVPRKSNAPKRSAT